MIWLIVAFHPPVTTISDNNCNNSLEVNNIHLSKLIVDFIEWRGLKEIAIVNIFNNSNIANSILNYNNNFIYIPNIFIFTQIVYQT